MNCNEAFNAGICYVTDAYKKVCRFNEELHADLEKCRSENAKLREACAELLKMAESSDPEWLHWPEIHDELRKLGVKIVKP